MSDQPEIFLLITAEADIVSGLALAGRLVSWNDYELMILVVSDKAAALVEHVKSRVAAIAALPAEKLQIESIGTDITALINHLETQPLLRFLLVPGLDQLNDNRKKLLRQIHATVVCFELHPGLEAEPERLWLIGEDDRGAVTWFCGHLCPQPNIVASTIDQLAASAKTEAGSLGHSVNDWVFMSAPVNRVDAAGKQAKAVIDAAVGPVVLVRSGDTWLQWMTNRFLPQLAERYAPQMTRETRQKLSAELSTFSKLDFEFIALICASTFLASFGLVQDSAAVIIGAMLVAPLMTPILGAGLALSQGNKPLFAGSLRTIAIGFLAALTTSTLFGVLIRVIPNTILPRTAEGIVLTGEMWSRTSPTIIDFLVGFVGGSAAAYARTRNHLSAALAGAAIAAALVPPIATAGIHISLTFDQIAPMEHQHSVRNLTYGPMLLFLANMLTIMIGSSFVLWACGVRGVHSHTSKDRWTTRMTILLGTLTAIVAVWIVQHS